MDKNISNRIKAIIEYLGVNIQEFANQLGYDSQEKIGRLIRKNEDEKKSYPSYNIIFDISNKFDFIDIDWLITGRGNMIRSTQKKNLSSQVQEPSPTYTASQDNSALIQEIKSLSIENYILKERIKEMDNKQKKELAQYTFMVEKK